MRTGLFDNEEMLMLYMRSDMFRHRCARMKKVVIARAKRGKKEWTFHRMASYLKVPVELVIADFQQAMAKRGMHVMPQGRVQ